MFRIGTLSTRAAAADVDTSHPLYRELARQHQHLRDPLLDLKDDVDFDDAIRGLVLEQQTTTRRRLSTASTLVDDEKGPQRQPPADQTAVGPKRWRLSNLILRRRSRSPSRKGSS